MLTLRTPPAQPAEQRARGIRPFRRSDLPAVAELYESVARSGKREPPPHLADYFARTFFDCPWTDAEIPSLVYQDERGGLLGFLGSHVRRARLDGRLIRVAYGGQLVVDPQARARAVGAMLFRTHLQGPQDATLTDGANEIVRRMWEISGGEASPLKTISWTRVLRPLTCGADFALGRLKRPSLARRLQPLWAPLDRPALNPLARRLRPSAPPTSEETLTPQAVLENLHAMTEPMRCHLAYDEPFLAWLFRELPQVSSRGRLVRSLLRDSAGGVVGWYVYYLQPGRCQVLQVAAKRGATGMVLDHLFHHAYVNGAAAVSGRLEPQLAEALSERRCLYGWHGGALIHSRNPALLGVLLSGKAWLSRMDGEWWMGHHAETFG